MSHRLYDCPSCRIKEIRLKELKEALKFYADQDNHKIDFELDVRLIDLDKGDRAREALRNA